MLDVCHHFEMLTSGTIFGGQGLQKNACKYGNSINFFKIFKFRILKSINFKKNTTCCYLLQNHAELIFPCYVLAWRKCVYSSLSGLLKLTLNGVSNHWFKSIKGGSQNLEEDL
jgi:hypothetical protein